MSQSSRSRLPLWAALCLCLLLPAAVAAAPFKVLVVMSYDDNYAWDREVKEGIDAVLGESCELKYFYMDTKRDLAGGERKGQQAFALYQEFKPDGVIAADDNAQSMFVVPFLKDKVETPVMFCGVNDKPEKYGYPAGNVSGILERLHIRNSIAFAQQLDPCIKRVAYVMKDSPSGEAVWNQYRGEFSTYPVKSVAFEMPRTLKEAVAVSGRLKGQVDALFIETMEGIPDENGKPLTDRQVIPILAETFGGPLISNNSYHVEYGTLCAVVKTGQEQGETAARMLLEAMQGKPVTDIPMVQNQQGRQMINVTVMKALGIKPHPNLLRDTQLVTTPSRFKVLVVMSYEEDFPWVRELVEGIQSVLSSDCDIKYFYMDTKKNLAGGERMAQQAFALYEEFKPDGVIAADDNAQTMFVVPYLKDRVKTPVMFCGVNADPGKYGYPAGNVSGILERGHIRESIAFLQELVPSIKTIGYIARDNPTGNAVLQQARSEADSFMLRSVAFRLVKTVDEAVAVVKELREESGALFVPTMEGIPDQAGKPLSETVVIPLLAETFGKPLISDNAYNIKYGILCSVVVTGQEQGAKSAKMLLDAMRGIPVADIPITRNHEGRRMINVTAMRKLGINPKPNALIGAEFVRTEE